MAKSKELKKRYGAKRESFVSFGSRLPCERLSFQRRLDSRAVSVSATDKPCGVEGDEDSKGTKDCVAHNNPQVYWAPKVSFAPSNSDPVSMKAKEELRKKLHTSKVPGPGASACPRVLFLLAPSAGLLRFLAAAREPCGAPVDLEARGYYLLASTGDYGTWDCVVFKHRALEAFLTTTSSLRASRRLNLHAWGETL